ncbi:Alcohol dehydrogenase superfamily, zinc-type [Metarhizium album ARSEF 1941]|uniref:Alcohol dehydrogenase superfamily, zinc-type n=1 Tax=Metarhizium album (strain ARSEF 1941) TaxID=1081103 RepID=A0A0B2WLU3_METAS|nr:Alcohol dehydrogenase superfamily, zinc-type [Metarhizium album ARSEF 1941]KHN94908.1 Alcohol dehydrogenase superfamily, zinc-type [Metarhizium album ARSEF 1941]
MATTHKAIVVQGPGVAKVVADRPLPQLRDDYILVKTVAVGLNPTDWKHIDHVVTEAGPVCGCDYAGIVEAVGPKVTKPFRVGDRIAGVAHGANVVQPEDGTFAEYIVVKGDVQIKIPDNISFEEAATLGIGISTVNQSLYQHLQLAPVSAPTKKPSNILIYGGSTATGTLAIQYAKLSGYTVVTTCSPRNFDLVRSLGADAAFDYADPECAAKIRNFTNNELSIVFDTISVPESVKICSDAIPQTTHGAKYHALLPVQHVRDDIQSSISFAYTQFGEPFVFGSNQVPAKPEDYSFAVQFWEEARGLLAAGKIKVHPPRVGNGLDGVLEGLQMMRENRVSGEKLVYKI